MKQKVINKVYFLSIIKNDKVIKILTGKNLDSMKRSARIRYPECSTQIMEYNDEYNVYVPDIEEQLMMIRRRYEDYISK